MVMKEVPILPWTGERCVPEAMHPANAILARHVARYRWAAERLIPLQLHRVVLDAPCGTGYGTAMLAASPNVAIVMGVDIDPATVTYARDRYGLPGAILFAVGDLTEVRTRADVVVCFEGIEHVADQEKAARALCAALKPGGLLLVSTPRAGGPGGGSPYHTHELRLEELVGLFAPYLTEIRVHGQDREVGDAHPETARSLVLEGRKHEDSSPALPPERPSFDGYADVDRTADPGLFVRHLHLVGTYKQKHAALAFPGVQEGDQILDVGCGIGDDVRELGRRVGSTGRVIGVDRGETMIAEARKRARGLDLPIEYRVGDAHCLDFPDDLFDGSRAERTFMHLEDPRRALLEMIRVTRPGGWIAVMEPDWETLVVDAPDRVLTRTILNFHCDSYRHGWIGRQLPALFRESGLIRISIQAGPLVLTDYTLADEFWGLRTAAAGAQAAGAVSAGEAATWLGHLEDASRAGYFFAAGLGFIVRGRKSAGDVAADLATAERVARYRWAADRLTQLQLHRVVLDAPCGTGYGTAMLAASPNVAIAMGVDIDPATIEYARDRYGLPGRTVFAIGDLAEVRTQADVVVCFEGIEHVADQEGAARALCEALKPGGLLLVSTPRAGGPDAGSPYHTHELPREELVGLFAPYLTEIRVHGQDREVADADPETARSLVLEGLRKTGEDGWSRSN